MKKWHIYGAVGATKYLGVVEAETKEDAEEKGMNLPEAYVSVCHHCSSEVGDPEIQSVTAEESDDE